ncbi:MAG: type II secretion system F family protein [Selenomonadaceae bacterium]|nr:type II secretion system F family protein [Selenomonadaceae bacterium]
MLVFIALAVTLILCGLIYLVLKATGSKEAQTERRFRQLSQEDSRKETKAKPDKKERDVAGNLANIPFTQRTIVPMLNVLQERAQAFTPREIKGALEARLLRAGKLDSWGVQRLAAGWVGLIICGGLYAFWLAGQLEILFIQRLAASLVGAIIGGAVPFLILQSLVNRRKAAIRSQLPEFLDLLCVSVQAGLSFDGAVTRIIARMKGPLIDECTRMQRDMRMGQIRRRSLQEMARRCDVEEVYLFTSSVIQADRLGTSMARTLAIQSATMRERHRQNIRKKALEAPIKMLFPMMMFIFPTIFVVLLMPPLLNVFNSGLTNMLGP